MKAPGNEHIFTLAYKSKGVALYVPVELQTEIPTSLPWSTKKNPSQKTWYIKPEQAVTNILGTPVKSNYCSERGGHGRK